MIHQEIHIPRYAWRVRVWYAVTGYHTQTILRAMKEAGCDEALLKVAKKQLQEGGLNTGLTWSNKKTRESVVVIAMTSSAEEFQNSFAHERRHLVAHIADAEGMDWMGEEICYLDGWLAQEMMKACHKLLCGTCRGERWHQN